MIWKLLKNSYKFKAGLLISLTVILYAFLINNMNLWSDEIYSVLMAKDSFAEMFNLLMTEDSKPPLYYLYLKGILALFPQQYEIFGAHFASYILLICAQLFTATEVRKDYGDKFALWLIFLMMVMPHSLWLAFEVRTYMLSSFLMLMVLVYGLRLLKKPMRGDFIKFGGCTLAALYTHYYCALWLMFFYFILSGILLKNRRRDCFKKLLLTATPVAVLFAPWLVVPLTTGDDISRVWYVNYDFVELSPTFFFDVMTPDILQSFLYITTLFCAGSFSFMVLCGALSLYRKKETSGFYIALGSFLLTYGLLIVLSYIFRPMVTARYLKIFSLIWYFAGAFVLTREKIFQKAFVGLALLGFWGTYQDVRYVYFDRGFQEVVNDIRSFVSPDDAIAVLDNANLFAEYYLPEYKYYLLNDGQGEALRLPSAAKQYETYVPFKKDHLALVLSTMGTMKNPERCKSYPSKYRFVNGGVDVCYFMPERINSLAEKTYKLRFHK